MILVAAMPRHPPIVAGSALLIPATPSKAGPSYATPIGFSCRGFRWRSIFNPRAPQRHIGGVQLTPEQYDRYEATAGPLVRQAFDVAGITVTLCPGHIAPPVGVFSVRTAWDRMPAVFSQPANAIQSPLSVAW